MSFLVYLLSFYYKFLLQQKISRDDCNYKLKGNKNFTVKGGIFQYILIIII